MPAVSRRGGDHRDRERRHDESGGLLIEVLIASTVLTIILTMVFLSTGTMTKATATQVRRGSLTGFAADGAAQLQQLLADAWTPQNPNSLGVTDDCAGGGDGQSFPVGQGPFVAATGTDIWLCSIEPKGSTAYTYELHFVACSAAGVCNLEADRQPAPGSHGPATPVLFIDSVSCPACVSVAGSPSPFTYIDDSTGSGTVLNPGGGAAAVGFADLHRVDSVVVNLTITGADTKGTTVRDDVSLFNALGGL